MKTRERESGGLFAVAPERATRFSGQIQFCGLSLEMGVFRVTRVHRQTIRDVLGE